MGNGHNIFNPIYQGIASTTEQYNNVHDLHSTSPRDTSEYDDEDISKEDEQSRRLLEASQSTKQGKVHIAVHNMVK